MTFFQPMSYYPLQPFKSWNVKCLVYFFFYYQYCNIYHRAPPVCSWEVHALTSENMQTPLGNNVGLNPCRNSFYGKLSFG